MRKKKLFATAFVALVALTAGAQRALSPLHVDGKWLADDEGTHVVLHGVMDTPNMYFNGWRWGTPWTGTNYDANGATKCLAYFEKIFVGLEKAYCDVFRLHLDPAWTNDPSDSYTYAGAADQPDEATSEADISKFNPERLSTFLSSLYIPLMQKAMNHGLYVVVRPPGVCPPNLKVGDYYQQYLLTVWDIVSKDATIQQYAGQISLELANEPVNLKNAYNQEDAKALHDYFQPIVNKIRANGFTGIIWIPGTGWQSNYTSYKSYPITGSNIGYAVHDYTGWYGCSDATPDPQNKINNFHNSVPVVDTNPIIITEVDWSPENPNAEGHYDEHGNWVLPNYGTWSTGSTSKWGKAYKAMLDHFGNISMTLSGTGCLIDIDELINNNNVTPAFGGLEEACGKACMDWYAEYSTGIKKVLVATGLENEVTDLSYVTQGNRFIIANTEATSIQAYKASEAGAAATPVEGISNDLYYYMTLEALPALDVDGNGTPDSETYYRIAISNAEGEAKPTNWWGDNYVNHIGWGDLWSTTCDAGKENNYGRDGEFNAVWTVKYVDGQGFTVYNPKNNKYMRLSNTSGDITYLRFFRDVKYEVQEVEIIEKSDNEANDEIFALSKMQDGKWTFDEPVSLLDWDYLMITTANSGTNASHEISITDANGKTVKGEDYDGSSAATGGKMWLDRWNNQNAIRISIDYLRETKHLDVRNITSLAISGDIDVANVWLTDYDNTQIGGGYAQGDDVREYTAAGSFGTVCLPYKAAVAGAKVYSVACKVDGGIGLQPVEGLLEAGKPYFYQAVDENGKDAAGQVCNVNFFRADFTRSDAQAPIENNGLIGTFADKTAPKGNNYYVLSNNKLYYTTGASVKVGANRAYLNLNKVQDIAAARLVLGLDNATGIEAIDNGQLTIDNWYDLNGRRVASSMFNVQSSMLKKGLYIVNGKKFIK
jgi:hypothetical protein